MNASPRMHGDDDPTIPKPVAPRPASRARGSITLTVLLFAISAGLVYYGSQLWVRNDAAHRALTFANRDLVELRKENSDRGNALNALDELMKETSAKLLELNTALAAAQTRLAELDEERNAIKEQLAEFQQLTQQFREMIDSGRLDVTFRRGRMIVELPAQVLFPSGSADLTEEGSKALGDVAQILGSMLDRRYIVAGHTDNVPVANERFRSNWELSSARAVKVTAALIRGGLRPEQLVAAGYSEHDPVADNANEAGRQKNRRIEIILEPRLAPVAGVEEAKTDKKEETSEKDAAGEPAAKP